MLDETGTIKGEVGGVDNRRDGELGMEKKEEGEKCGDGDGWKSDDDDDCCRCGDGANDGCELKGDENGDEPPLVDMTLVLLLLLFVVDIVV